jgi:hypothetical protein
MASRKRGSWFPARGWEGGAAQPGGPSAHRARGHPALALTLPGLSYYGSPAGLGLAHALDYVVSEVERRDLANVVLACHSRGGSNLARPAGDGHTAFTGRSSTATIAPERGVPLVLTVSSLP